MTRAAVQQVVQRAISDVTFRGQLRDDPQGALRGFDLTPDERGAITSADSGRLAALGIESRMSKMYATGALEASRSIVADPGTSSSITAIPPTHLQMIEKDLDTSSVGDSQMDDRLYFAGGTQAAPDPTVTDGSAFTPVLEGGTVDGNTIDPGVVEPGISIGGGEVPTDT
jgi:hypothetical protein